MCLATRSLRLVLSLTLSDCLYCHFSGAKGHFISTASCRREATSGHNKPGWENCVLLFITWAKQEVKRNEEQVSVLTSSNPFPPHMLVTLLCCSLIRGCTIIPLCVVALYLFACEMWMPKLTVMVMALGITITVMNGTNKLQNFESWGSQVTRCCPQACLAWLVRNILFIVY